MFHLLITVPDFPSRFPKAWQTLSQCELFRLHLAPSINSLLSQNPPAPVLLSADGLFLAADRLDNSVLQYMPHLKIAAKMGSGMDNINQGDCRARQILVINSKGQNTNAVAEMTLCLILSLMRRVLPLSRAAEAGNWSARCPGSELTGKSIGLVGFGMIAQRLAKLLAPFSVTLYACDPFMNEEAAERLHVTPVSFSELLPLSDVVSVHIPGLPENENMFCSSVFSQMKRNAFFINCSRGSLVKEEDLYEALKQGIIKGAACDVFRQEPLPAGNPLFTLPNFIGTPHLAGMTEESMVGDSMEIAEKLIRFFQNGKR